MSAQSNRCGWVGYAAILVLVVAVLALGLIDPNGRFLSANDIYHFRQKIQYLDVLFWTQEDLSGFNALDKVARFVFWIFYYFHGALPQLFFMPILAGAELFGPGVTPFMIQALVTLFGLATVLLFHDALRRGGLSPAGAVTGALLLAVSPLFVGLIRGAGTEWFVNGCFAQVLVIWALLRLDGRRGAVAVSLACTNAILSDPLSFLVLGAAVTAWFVEAWRLQGASAVRARLAVLMLPKVWLLPGVALLAVAAWNVVRWKFQHLIPGEATLFIYPFLKYLTVTTTGTADRFGPGGWLKISVLSFGLAAPLALPLTALAAAALPRWGRLDLLTTWSIIASLGFGAMFYVISGPSTGSAGMPYFGYPAYTLVPVLTFLAVQGDRLVRAYARPWLGAVVAATLVTVGLYSTVCYVWRLYDAPAARLLADRADDVPLDNVGVRRPESGDQGAGWAVRAAVLERLARGQTALSLAFWPSGRTAALEAFWLYAGLDSGGRWFSTRGWAKPYGAAVLFARPEDGMVQVTVTDLSRKLVSGEKVDASAVRCAAEACLLLSDDPTLTVAGARAAFSGVPALSVVDGGRLLYQIYAVGDVVLPQRGTVDVAELNAKFRTQYRSVFDILPHAESGAFLDRLCQGIRCGR